MRPKKEENPDAIGSEDTLKMIMMAMKSETGGDKPEKPKKKKTEQAVTEGMIGADLETVDEEENKKKSSTTKKAKKSSKAKKSVVKTPVDGITRFFNDYGESPHLQAIETSYLLYLQAQFAKESHLKAVKKF